MAQTSMIVGSVVLNKFIFRGFLMVCETVTSLSIANQKAANSSAAILELGFEREKASIYVKVVGSLP